MPKTSGYVKTFKIKNRDKEKNNKLMSFRIDDDKLLAKYKTIWTKIEILLIIKLDALPVYDDRYIKNEIRTYGDKVCTNFCGLKCDVIFKTWCRIWVSYNHSYWIFACLWEQMLSTTSIFRQLRY